MSVQYSLTLTSESKQPGLNFDVYGVSWIKTEGSYNSRAASMSSAPVYPLAWLSTPGGPGSTHKVSWTPEYSLLCAGQGCRADSVWSPDTAPLSVDPDVQSRNTAFLDYQGDYLLSIMDGSGLPLDPDKVYLVTSPRVPEWSQAAGPSVGLAVKAAASGGTAIPVPSVVTDSGPNLLHTFDLNIVYRVQLSSDEQATMTDWNAVQNYKLVDFGSCFAAECTLQTSNIWACNPS
jgi:hypothetical protein